MPPLLPLTCRLCTPLLPLFRATSRCRRRYFGFFRKSWKILNSPWPTVPPNDAGWRSERSNLKTFALPTALAVARVIASGYALGDDGLRRSGVAAALRPDRLRRACREVLHEGTDRRRVLERHHHRRRRPRRSSPYSRSREREDVVAGDRLQRVLAVRRRRGRSRPRSPSLPSGRREHVRRPKSGSRSAVRRRAAAMLLAVAEDGRPSSSAP